MKLCKLLLPCLLLLAMAAPSAKAHDGLGGLGLAYLYGYGGLNSTVTSSYNRSQPYFALHPPVYYGQRYARPYGASPFAAWPQLQAAPGYAPQVDVTRTQCRPMTISNPYAPGVSTGVVNNKAVVAPVQALVIENPYFTSPDVQYTSTQK